MTDEMRIMYIFVDLVGCFIVLLLRFDFGNENRKIKGFNEKLFHTLTLVTSFIFIADIFTWIYNGDSNRIFINYLVNAIYYTSHPVIASIWVMYVNYKLYDNKSRTKKMIPYLIVPCFIIGGLSFMSYKHPIFFGITDEGFYYRAEYYVPFTIANMLFFVFSTWQIINKIRVTTDIAARRKYKFDSSTNQVDLRIDAAGLAII